MYDRNRIEELALAFLGLTKFKDGGCERAWKGMDWDVLDGLYRRGWIHDPRGKAKSIVFTDEGARLVTDLQERYFSTPHQADGEGSDYPEGS